MDSRLVYHYSPKLLLEKRSYVLQPVNAVFLSPTRLYGNQRGLTLGGEFRVIQTLGQHTRQRFTFLFQPVRPGDDLFERVWRTLRQHKAT